MSYGLYITATDTDAGKTVITALFGKFLKERGRSIITQKPIQSGCDGFPEDIATHLEIMGIEKSAICTDLLKLMCPYRFKLPASAHLAASVEDRTIDSNIIAEAYRQLSAQYEFTLVEGIGGAMVPTSTGQTKCTISDIAAELKTPAIVIANNKLGVINHTLLTIEALKSRDISILGFIFNGEDSSSDAKILTDNSKAISDFSSVEFLGQLPFTDDFDKLTKSFEPIGERILNKLTSYQP